jgi:solute carrier family 25 protein 33/36
VAGVTTVTVVNPVWVIKTRLQLQGAAQTQAGAPGLRSEGGVAYRGSFDAFRQILREEGVRGFYKGLIPSIWGVSETAIQFVLYERLKSLLSSRHSQGVQGTDARGAQPPKQTELRNLEYIGAAASAKVVASCSTYPHEVIRTRLRERGASQIYHSAIHCVQRIWVEEGVRGLYGGLGTHLLRVVPNTAILFFTYEKVSKMLSASTPSS